jgi:hypothetical protein
MFKAYRATLIHVQEEGWMLAVARTDDMENLHHLNYDKDWWEAHVRVHFYDISEDRYHKLMAFMDSYLLLNEKKVWANEACTWYRNVPEG